MFITVNYCTYPKTATATGWAWSAKEVDGKEVYHRELSVAAAKRKIAKYREKFGRKLTYESYYLDDGCLVHELFGFID